MNHAKSENHSEFEFEIDSEFEINVEFESNGEFKNDAEFEDQPELNQDAAGSLEQELVAALKQESVLSAVLPTTQHRVVDQALEPLATLTQTPLAQHPELYEQAHRSLVDLLASAAAAGGRPVAGPPTAASGR